MNLLLTRPFCKQELAKTSGTACHPRMPEKSIIPAHDGVALPMPMTLMVLSAGARLSDFVSLRRKPAVSLLRGLIFAHFERAAGCETLSPDWLIPHWLINLRHDQLWRVLISCRNATSLSKGTVIVGGFGLMGPIGGVVRLSSHLCRTL